MLFGGHKRSSAPQKPKIVKHNRFGYWMCYGGSRAMGRGPSPYLAYMAWWNEVQE